MKRLLWTGLAALALWSGSLASQARAQYQPNYQRPSNPIPQPALSPYLDLRGNRNSPAINYFLGTLPELDRRANDLRFGNAILDIDRRLAVSPAEAESLGQTLPQTGHAAYFANYGGYYNLYGSRVGLPGSQQTTGYGGTRSR